MPTYDSPSWAGPCAFPVTLEIIKNGTIIDSKRFTGSHILIGRDADAVDVHVVHPSASRCHAVLQWSDSGTLHLADLGSAHGTVLNQQRVQPGEWSQALVDGCCIQIGASSRTFVLVVPELAAAPAPAPAGGGGGEGMPAPAPVPAPTPAAADLATATAPPPPAAAAAADASATLRTPASAPSAAVQAAQEVVTAAHEKLTKLQRHARLAASSEQAAAVSEAKEELLAARQALVTAQAKDAGAGKSHKAFNDDVGAEYLDDGRDDDWLSDDELAVGHVSRPAMPASAAALPGNAPGMKRSRTGVKLGRALLPKRSA